MGNQGDQGASGEFIERRRAALERFINRTANHPILRVDPDFRDFLESGKVAATFKSNHESKTLNVDGCIATCRTIQLGLKIIFNMFQNLSCPNQRAPPLSVEQE